jgi:hypothetical protein
VCQARWLSTSSSRGARWLCGPSQAGTCTCTRDPHRPATARSILRFLVLRFLALLFVALVSPLLMILQITQPTPPSPTTAHSQVLKQAVDFALPTPNAPSSGIYSLVTTGARIDLAVSTGACCLIPLLTPQDRCHSGPQSFFVFVTVVLRLNTLASTVHFRSVVVEWSWLCTLAHRDSTTTMTTITTTATATANTPTTVATTATREHVGRCCRALPLQSSRNDCGRHACHGAGSCECIDSGCRMARVNSAPMAASVFVSATVAQ